MALLLLHLITLFFSVLYAVLRAYLMFFWQGNQYTEIDEKPGMERSEKNVDRAVGMVTSIYTISVPSIDSILVQSDFFE